MSHAVILTHGANAGRAIWASSRFGVLEKSLEEASSNNLVDGIKHRAPRCVAANRLAATRRGARPRHPEKSMIVGYHVIFSTYGFWLPNDPRGSWSDFVGSWEL